MVQRNQRRLLRWDVIHGLWYFISHPIIHSNLRLATMVHQRHTASAFATLSFECLNIWLFDQTADAVVFVVRTVSLYNILPVQQCTNQICVHLLLFSPLEVTPLWTGRISEVLGWVFLALSSLPQRQPILKLLELVIGELLDIQIITVHIVRIWCYKHSVVPIELQQAVAQYLAYGHFGHGVETGCYWS